MENQKKLNPRGKKIVFTGLDNAGKTSIILALQREIAKIAVVKPTKGAQRRDYEFLGMKIVEWDLGGQQKYRRDYLTNTQFFDMSDIAIYVIDVQNKNRVIESLNYLKAVIKRFNDFGINPSIFIFFHKFDPVEEIEFKEEFNNLALYIEHQIEKSIDYEKLIYYKTTIFDISTIIKALSTILLDLFPKEDLLHKTIVNFAHKFKAEGIELIDNNSLIVASFYKNEEIKGILNKSTPFFLSLNDVLVKPDSEKINNTNLIQIERIGKYFLFKQFSLIGDLPPYHLLIFKNDPIFELDTFNSLVEMLKGLLYN